MPGITQDFQKGMLVTGYDYMMETYDTIEEVWPKYMAEKEVDGDNWETTTVINVGNFRKTGETEAFQPQKVEEGFTVYARVFDFTQAIALTKNVISDHQKTKNFIKDIAGSWGIQAKETREEFYARPFNKGGLTAGDWIFNGTSGSGRPDPSGDGAYDGTSGSPIPWFNLAANARSSKGGATYYNAHALSLSPDNLKTILLHMVSANNRRENDTRMRLDPDCIVYPTDLDMAIKEILNSTLAPYLSTNTTNVLQGVLEPIKNPYFDDTDAFFIGHKPKGNSPAGWRGLVALKREEPVFDFFQDKLSRCWWATAEMRIGFMMNNWRFWSASQVSQS